MIDLHVHTKYSLLDSISEPKQLIKKTKELNRHAICITEHGNLYSSIEIYKLCKENNVKYLHGCEMYICDNVLEKNKDNRYYHLILISKNEQGRQNLIKLVSLSNNYKYYGKPRIDFEILKQYKEGLIVLSACMAGEIQRLLLNNDYKSAKIIAQNYKKEFKEDYYLEYQSHTDLTQQKLNRLIVDLANELNIKYVVTTDSHFINNEDQKYHNIFVQIGQSREAGEIYNDCYIQTDEEVLKKCKSTTENENLNAMNNTYEIMDKCNVEIPLSAPIMPHVDIPEQFNSEIDYLTYLCVQGWKNRKINLLSQELKYKYKERLKYELKVIKKMGFEGYFLLVYSYANSVKRRGIARGSGGGSLVAYLTNIVDIDPVKYGLYFERFIDVGALRLLEEGKISKEQLKIPDFDLDFGKEDRNKVMQFITDKYGKQNVASLGSFQYIWAKGAIKDIGKVLGIPFETTNEITKKLNNETIDEALNLGLLDEYKDLYPELFKYTLRLAGLPKSFSMHPCGKVITMKSIDYYNAIELSDDNEYILQGDMHTAEDLGLIKIDVLGLKTIDIIYDTLEMIDKKYEYIAPHNINFDDKKVLENFRKGYTAGVFQFESDGMKGTLSSIECKSLYDLSIANALYRPGSIEYISNYANRRKGIEKYEFLHEDLKDILKDSYAIIVFQEQLIEIGKIAGLSNPDELRQATAKKKKELMAKIKPELFEGLKKRDWNDEQLVKLWDNMLQFAKYSFNKSHSAAYAIIAYICMYLKTYHPKEFIASWINSCKGKIEKLPICINEANRLNIKVLIPIWNEITDITIVKNDNIYLGTQSIKFLNSQVAQELYTLSQQNTYINFIDLIKDIKEKTSTNSRQLRILTGLNFFSEFGKNKKLLSILDLYETIGSVKQIKKDKIEELGLNLNILLKYTNKETAKLYKDIDIVSYIKEISELIEDKTLSVKEEVKFQYEYLEYTTVKYPEADDGFYIVVEYKCYKDKTKPYLTLRNLKTGEELKTKVKNSKYFSENPFKLFDILQVLNFKTQKKIQNNGGKWERTNIDEQILDEWVVY